MAGLRTLSVLLLAGSGLSQPATYPVASTDCTDASSKAVSWEIRNFSFNSDTKLNYGIGNAKKVTFTVKNSANGYTFECLQGNENHGRAPNHWLEGGKLWYGCSAYCNGAMGFTPEPQPALDTKFSFDPSTKSLSLSQAWKCGSGAQSNNYTASGSSVVSGLSCKQVPDGRTDQIACAPVDVTIKASNVSVNLQVEEEDPYEDSPFLVEGLPSRDGGPSLNNAPAPDPAVKPDTAGCKKRSDAVTWTLSNLRHNEVGARLDITNNALNYTQRCNFYDLGTGFEAKLNAKSWWNCTRVDNMHANWPPNGIFSSVLYGGDRNTFGVNQTWYCSDEDANNPTIYSAYTETNLDIKCNQTRTCIPAGRYQEGPTFSTVDSCTTADLTLSPVTKAVYKVTKQQAYEEFKPRGYNCSGRSLGEGGRPPTWEITGFRFNRTWIEGEGAADAGAFMDEAEFTYHSTATDSDWPVSEQDRTCYAQTLPGAAFDGKVPLVCAAFQMRDRAFRFDFNASTLSLNQEWSCDGVDLLHSNAFRATGSAKLPLECKAVGNGTSCVVPAKVTVPMSTITKNLNLAVPAATRPVRGNGR